MATMRDRAKGRGAHVNGCFGEAGLVSARHNQLLPTRKQASSHTWRHGFAVLKHRVTRNDDVVESKAHRRSIGCLLV